jgi:DNA-binding transcriptional MerR regulator
MEYIDFRKFLKKYRITVKAFAKILGVTEQATRLWKKIGLPQYVIINIELFERLSSEEKERFLQEKLNLS